MSKFTFNFNLHLWGSRIVSVLTIAILFSVAADGQKPAVETADSLARNGVQLYSQQKLPEALASLRQSIKLEPAQPEVQLLIGTIQAKLGDLENAVLSLREAIRLSPLEGRYHSQLCSALSVLRQQSEAIKECREGVRLDPASEAVRKALIGAMRRGGSPNDEIDAAFDQALERFRNSEALLRMNAEYRMDSGDTYGAISVLIGLSEMRPESAMYHGMLGDAYRRIGRDAEALGEARRALQLAPDDPYANYAMGAIFYELGLHEEASEAFSKTVASWPEFPRAYFLLSKSQSLSGRWTEALQSIRKATTVDPDSFENQLELGTVLNHLSLYEEAIAPMRRALSMRHDDIQALAGLSLSLFESTRYEEANEILSKANQKFPGNYVLEMFARVSRNRQSGLLRIPTLIETAKKDPEDLSSRVELIELYMYSRRPSEAESYAEQLWKLKPTQLKIYGRVSAAYATAGLRDKAMEVYRRGLQVGEDAGFYFGMATLYTDAGEYEKAFEAYEKSIRLRPDAPGVYQFYGDALQDGGKRREALNAFKSSLAIKPANSIVTFQAGILSAKLGELDQARAYLEVLKGLDQEMADRLETILRLKLF